VMTYHDAMRTVRDPPPAKLIHTDSDFRCCCSTGQISQTHVLGCR
jgi:hypothetical protein